jgi:RNA polymerase sigma-70 factor (ECF subfamily)
LPSQARAVFVLFALEGYQHNEIAEMLGIAEGSSKAQYHRARQLLRSWVDEN